LRPRPALFPPEEQLPSPAATPAPAASPAPATSAHSIEKQRGRLERRTLESTTLLTVSRDWVDLQQGFRIRRAITRRGETTIEVVHGITSLPTAQADATRLLEAVRDHWQVENRLHYVRDVTLGEDACRVQTGQAPQNLAACRNAVVCLLARVAEDSCLAAIQRLAARPDEALALLKSQE
jgi:predicted transposase YbfD/YdcC